MPAVSIDALQSSPADAKHEPAAEIPKLRPKLRPICKPKALRDCCHSFACKGATTAMQPQMQCCKPSTTCHPRHATAWLPQSDDRDSDTMQFENHRPMCAATAPMQLLCHAEPWPASSYRCARKVHAIKTAWAAHRVPDYPGRQSSASGSCGSFRLGLDNWKSQ